MSLKTRIACLEAAHAGPDTCPCGRSGVQQTLDTFAQLVLEPLVSGGEPVKDWARCRWCRGRLPPLPDDFVQALDALIAGDPVPLQTWKWGGRMQLKRRIRSLEQRRSAEHNVAIERELARLQLTPEEQAELVSDFIRRKSETRHAAKATHPGP